MSQIHVSLDDVKGIFKALICGESNSIFDTRTLSFLRALHDEYGVRFDLFCTYQHGSFLLSKVPNKFIGEFKENADWINLCFHCFDEADKYNEMEDNVFFQKYDEFIKERIRLVGNIQKMETLRIHRFEGRESICRRLRQCGVLNLLCADDERLNYYLNNQENIILNKNYNYYDCKNDLMFYKSCTRLENAEDIRTEIERYLKMGIKIIPVFTHECAMDREDVRRKMIEVCKMVREY